MDMDSQSIETRFCFRCKETKEISEYKTTKNGKLTKTCQKCLDKYPYKRCETHSRCSGDCRPCSDRPLEILLRRMVASSRKYDKERGFYDADKFVDFCFLQSQICGEIQYCPYCSTQMTHCDYDRTLMSIERIDNSIGHIKSNVMFCCLRCNLGRVGDRLNDSEKENIKNQ